MIGRNVSDTSDTLDMLILFPLLSFCRGHLDSGGGSQDEPHRYTTKSQKHGVFLLDVVNRAAGEQFAAEECK